MTFLERNADDLRALFDVLGHSSAWTDDEAELIAWMERAWLGTEHGPGDGKQRYTDEQVEAAWPLLRALEVVDRVPPREPGYNHVVVMGAAAIGLHRRLELVRTSGVRAGTLSVLAGMRPHSGLARDGGLDELLAEEGRFAPAPGWRCPPLLRRSADLLAATDPLVAAQVVLPSETDLARLLLGKQWPDLRLPSREPAGDDVGVPNELGVRDHLLERWTAAVGDVVLLHGRAVDRSRPGASTQPPPRPTSRSTLVEWLQHVALPAAASTVLIVVNQPHLSRVELDLREELAAVGRTDMTLSFAGCEATRASDLTLLLGELPARANLERRAG